MPEDISNRLVIAISSRALFDLDFSNQIFENEGIEAYAKHQIDHEDEILSPGVAFSLVKKLLALNTKDSPRVEVILLSRNSADTGLRIFNSIQHYGLEITRAAFTNGESTFPYVSAFGSHLFLSTNPNDVKNALCSNCAAATILSSESRASESSDELRIAFDGDAVLFSDESEIVFHNLGLSAFSRHEKEFARQPLSGGPFKGFLSALHELQKKYPPEECPIRTALVTARSAPAHERIVHTFRAWDIRIDEALFLGGLDKAVFLKAFNADIFFDDQQGHCNSAKEHVATGHVPHGIKNL